MGWVLAREAGAGGEGEPTRATTSVITAAITTTPIAPVTHLLRWRRRASRITASGGSGVASLVANAVDPSTMMVILCLSL